MRLDGIQEARPGAPSPAASTSNPGIPPLSLLSPSALSQLWPSWLGLGSPWTNAAKADLSPARGELPAFLQALLCLEEMGTHQS